MHMEIHFPDLFHLGHKQELGTAAPKPEPRQPSLSLAQDASNAIGAVPPTATQSTEGSQKAMKALALILSLFQFLPAVLQGIFSVDSAAKQTGLDVPGPAKKDIFMTVFQAAVAAGETIPEQHVQAISAMADLLIGKMKTNGMMPQSAPATAFTAQSAVSPQPIVAAPVV